MVAKKERYGVRRRKKLGNGGGNREREGEQKEKEWRKKREQKRKTGTQNIKGETGKKAQRKNTYNDREKETGGDAMELLRNLWVPRGATPPPGVTTDQQDVGTAFKSHRDSGAPEGVVI